MDTIEVWLTQQPEDFDAGKTSSSVLDRFTEDRNFLEMAGKAMQASRVYREAAPEGEL